MDTIAADTNVEEDAVDSVLREELQRDLWLCVDSLEEQQGEIIRKRYQERMTLEELGQQACAALHA